MKNTIIFLILLVIFLTSGLFTACDDTITNQNIDAIIIPSSNVSYSQYIQPLFNIKCTSSGCHDNASRAGGLSLTTYSNVIADPSVVFPGQPENSILVWAIEGNAGAKPMPPITAPVTPMTQNQVQGIKTWIKEGAQNN